MDENRASALFKYLTCNIAVETKTKSKRYAMGNVKIR